MRPIDFFDTAADRHGEATALVDGDVRLSYVQLRAASEQVAPLFVRPAADGPTRVALISPNDYRVIVTTLAAMRAGATLIPVHVADSATRKSTLLDHVRPDVVLYHSAVGAEVRAIRSALASPTLWVCLDAADNGDMSLAEATATTATVPDWGDPYGNPNRTVYIRQTSGTSGTPKIVLNDVGSFAATVYALRQLLTDRGDACVCLVAAPLSHAAGVHAFAMLTLGAALVLMRDFDADAVLRAIPLRRVTHLWLPPTALYLLLSHPEVRRHDYTSLRSLVLGAAAVASDRLREAVSVFGPCVSINYSQIEGGFLTSLDARTVAAAVGGDHPERLKSSGTSLFSSRVAIMDDEGRLLGPGQPGEIVVRGRGVKPYQDEAARTEAHRYGWHHTGDLGYLDTDGYLYVVGRLKDNIITGGFKVSAMEVEEVILEVPAVDECAVVAVSHPLRGEAVAAVVTAKSGRALLPADILRHCKERIGAVKAPRYVHCWSELPKTAVGKVDKRRIRQQLEARP